MDEPVSRQQRTMASDDAFAQAFDAASEFIRDLPHGRVFPTESALQRLDAYDPDFPAGPCDPRQVVEELLDVARGTTVRTAGPRYFGYVIGGVVPAAAAAHLLAGAWDQLGTDYRLSPLAVRLEELSGRWLTDLLGLPARCSVNYVTGSTMASFIGLAAARSEIYDRLGWDVQAKGLIGAPPIRIFAGAEAHSTMFKALGMLGFGTAGATIVPVDEQGRMRARELPELGPDCIVLAQAGNVNSGSFDPIDEICDRAGSSGAWVHVDGAFGLLAAASPAYAALLKGYERADSWNVDGHKWLNTPYDCGVAICRHPGAVRRAFTIAAGYLGSDSRDPKDSVPELSRRGRGIEMWAALRSLGRQGIRELVDRNCAQARQFAEGLKELGFEILNEVALNQCVARYGSPERTVAITSHVQRSGVAWFSTTKWQGATALRLSCSSWMTSPEDVAMTLEAIAAAMDATSGID